MKGSGTYLHSSIANGGKGCCTLEDVSDETNWFDKPKTLSDTTEVKPPLMMLNGHCLLSI